MPKHTLSLHALLFSLCCQLSSYACAQVSPTPVLRSQDAGENARERLASGKSTPLDALTPYGKREATRQLQWRENTLVGFGFAPLIRELDRDQLAAVLHFLEADSYRPMLERKLVGPSLRLPAPSKQVEQYLQSFRQFADEDRRRRDEAKETATLVGMPAILRRYRELFDASLLPESLKAQPLGDLLPLFDATSLAVAGNPASVALDDMLRVHDELITRGIDTRRTVDDAVLHAMLAARRFSQARAFAAMRPHLADSLIPHVTDLLGPNYQGRSVFDFDAATNQLTRLAYPSPQGRELVMVVGAGCHSSTRALQTIRDDHALLQRLRKANIVLITAPDSPVDTRLMAEWNASHPEMQIRAPYNAAEWKAIDVTGIPSFFLLNKGRVVDQRTGWPVDGKANLEELIGRVD